MRIEDLITSYVSSEPISYSKFIGALICGDYEAFRANSGEDSSIVSVFRVGAQKVHSPLLILRILALLRSFSHKGKNVEEKHIQVSSILEYFESLGVDDVYIDFYLKEMIDSKLIEPYDLALTQLGSSQRLAITYKGMAHYDLATRSGIYFYQMALITAISDDAIAEKIKSIYYSKASSDDRVDSIKGIFSGYILSEDKKYIKNNSDKAQYECQSELLVDILNYGVNITGNDVDLPDNITSLLGRKIIGTVKRYDLETKAGYIRVDGIGDDIYFNTEKLELLDMDMIADLDVVYCKVGVGGRGLIVKSIEGLTEDGNNLHIYACEVKAYYQEKGYGFCYIEGSSNEAFFHVVAFPSNFVESIVIGMRFKAEIRIRDDGKYQVRRFLGIK
jgi:cold shock CspA family protein